MSAYSSAFAFILFGTEVTIKIKLENEEWKDEMEDKTSSSFKVVAARIEKEVSIVVTTN